MEDILRLKIHVTSFQRVKFCDTQHNKQASVTDALTTVAAPAVDALGDKFNCDVLTRTTSGKTNYSTASLKL